MPIYEPDRERIVLSQVQNVNRGPLEHRHLMQIYERILDVMRNIQKEEIVAEMSIRSLRSEGLKGAFSNQHSAVRIRGYSRSLPSESEVLEMRDGVGC